MRELKGTWLDLFAGFKVALHLSKMFLGFVGLVLTMLMVYASVQVANWTVPGSVQAPAVLVPHEFIVAQLKAWHVIFEEGTWLGAGIYGILYAAIFTAIWSFLGGAICRIAAYEITRDGERIELRRAVKFARAKFPALFGAFVLCVAGFAFFFLCNFIGGAVGRILDLMYVGGIVVSIFLPLAILSGFLMALILLASLAGWPLFLPAVGTEGTDAFDAVSRGFSYVYSSPWHYLWHQLVVAVYGWFCIAVVFLFAVVMSWLGAQAGAWGWHAIAKIDEGDGRFMEINHKAFSNFLSDQWIHRGTGPNRIYSWRPERILREPHPYGRLQHLANYFVWRVDLPRSGVHGPPPFVGVSEEIANKPIGEMTHWGWNLKLAYYIVCIWLFVTFGLAWGYVVSYLFSQQTMIYLLLRKRVDGIEMNEVYEEEETEAGAPPPPPPPSPPPAAEEKKEGVEKPPQQQEGAGT